MDQKKVPLITETAMFNTPRKSLVDAEILLRAFIHQVLSSTAFMVLDNIIFGTEAIGGNPMSKLVC